VEYINYSSRCKVGSYLAVDTMDIALIVVGRARPAELGEREKCREWETIPRLLLVTFDQKLIYDSNAYCRLLLISLVDFENA
jgi:hypothetical protein